MEQQLSPIFTNMSALVLLGTIAASLFFLSIGLRETKNQFIEGVLYYGMSLFFAAIHFLYLFNIPADTSWAADVANIDFWGWTVSMFVPALITTLLLRGLIDLAGNQLQPGLYRLFFGTTLLCFVYLLGANWPTDSKAIIAAFYGFTWLDMEQTFY